MLLSKTLVTTPLEPLNEWCVLYKKPNYHKVASDLGEKIVNQYTTMHGALEYAIFIFSKRKDPTTNVYPGYGTKPSDEATVLELRGIWSSSLSPLLSGPLWFGVVELFRVQSMAHIEMFIF